MAYNRKQRLNDNIKAIETAFILDREQRTPTARERLILERYCGFGGLKCILNPARELADAVHWAKSDLELFAPTVELHRLIRENSKNESEYKQLMDSLKKAVLYIALRDAYQKLYTYEAEEQTENKQMRESLNVYYDAFFIRFGNLNAKQNVKFILMDASGRDMLSLERVENGQFVKADIFDHPVSFSLDEVSHVDSPEEALTASLNKFGSYRLAVYD